MIPRARHPARNDPRRSAVNPPGSFRRRAFTIIEIMVALALLGLVVAAIYSSWIAIVRATNTGKKVTAEVQRTRVAVRTIEEALMSACSFAGDVQNYAFLANNGDDASISFVAHLSKSFPRSGRFGAFEVRRVSFSLEPGEDSGKDLVLRQNPILMDWDIDEKEHPVVLARDVKDFKLEFWDSQLNPPDWVDEWDRTNQMPSLVMFTLALGHDPMHPSQPREEILRIVSVPSVMVQTAWQAPGLQPVNAGNRGPQPGSPPIQR
jgi:type II secretion system protein J